MEQIGAGKAFSEADFVEYFVQCGHKDTESHLT